MKKLFLILITFFLIGCAALESPVSVGMSKYQYCAAKNLGAIMAICNKRYYYFKNGVEVLNKGNMFAVFKDVTEPTTSDAWTTRFGNGTFVGEVYSWTQAQNIINKLDPSSTGSEVAKKTPSGSSSSGSKRRASGGASGSAFFVTNKGHIITNYHVIQGCNTNPKIKYKNKDVEAKVIARDTNLDLALLKADLRNTKYVALSNDQPKKLQRVIASGYPFGKYISDDLKFTSGIVSSLKGPGDDSTLVQVDAALNPGNSGGPIVDEETGKLVAVSVMGMKKSISEGQNFGIKTSSVKNFLETNKVKVPTSWFGTSDVARLLEDSTLYTFCR